MAADWTKQMYCVGFADGSCWHTRATSAHNAVATVASFPGVSMTDIRTSAQGHCSVPGRETLHLPRTQGMMSLLSRTQG
jgi:hypothetical protein